MKTFLPNSHSISGTKRAQDGIDTVAFGDFWRASLTELMWTLLLFATLAGPMAGQSKLSIQGVWRPVELNITASMAPADAGGRAANRKDPFGAFPEGIHTSLQPGLVIFTDKHYSRTTVTAHAVVAKDPRAQGEKNIGQVTRVTAGLGVCVPKKSL